MSIKEVIENINLDRIEWQKRIHVIDPDQFVEDASLIPKFWTMVLLLLLLLIYSENSELPFNGICACDLCEHLYLRLLTIMWQLPSRALFTLMKLTRLPKRFPLLFSGQSLSLSVFEDQFHAPFLCFQHLPLIYFSG